MKRTKVMVVFGTRPEAIKMAPVVLALKASPGIETMVVVTAQHREMLDRVLALFDIQPDHDLDLMRPGQVLDTLFASVLKSVGRILEMERPDLVLVHGDTSTTLASSLAAFHARVPIGHVEAGLRTGDLGAPWPEEGNRRLVSPLARLHFAPTQRARANLLAEGIPADWIHVTGNTVVDALHTTVAKIADDPALADSVDSRLPTITPGRKLVLVTGHRRENFGAAFENVCRALLELSGRTDIQTVYPVHLNPSVQEPVHRILGATSNITLIPPLDYLPFVRLMSAAALIITDSGGIQEEAPALGIPVLVTREKTERPEAVDAGTVILVGTDATRIVAEASRLLDSSAVRDAMAHPHHPYGDGKAAAHIARIIARADL